MPMKSPLIICILWILLGCQENKKETSSDKDHSVQRETQTDAQTVATKSTSFPIGVIIENAPKRRSNYELKFDFDYPVKLIKPGFFEKYLANYPIKNIKNFSIEFDRSSRYYFFDFVEFEEFVLFTIMHNDEIGYNNFYHYTYDKKTDKITHVVMIASEGGDGGHSQEERLIYSNAFKDLLVKTTSHYDEDLFDEAHQECYSRLSDISETRYKFRQQQTEIIDGKMQTMKDTICE